MTLDKAGLNFSERGKGFFQKNYIFEISAFQRKKMSYVLSLRSRSFSLNHSVDKVWLEELTNFLVR